MTATPTVSIITSTYNGTDLVGPTIDSVLAQTFTDFEMIIVDDCSKDATVELLRSYDDPRLRIVVNGENMGPVRTRNRAQSLARGRYIAGLDQDDVCRPDRLARQVAYLEAHPDTVLVAAAAELLEDGRLRPPPPPARTTPGLVRFMLDIANPLVWSSVMIRADAARRLDQFTRPEICYAEDFDLYHRLAPLGAIARIDEPLMAYRIHAGGVSKLHADRMMGSAIRVLTAAHVPIFWEEAEETATLVARHFAGKLPAPDAATLTRVAAVLDRLLERAAAGEMDGDTEALIAHEASRLWWDLVRASINSGMLGRREALAVRPSSPLVCREPRGSGLFKAGIIGRARALRQRFTDETERAPA